MATRANRGFAHTVAMVRFAAALLLCVALSLFVAAAAPKAAHADAAESEALVFASVDIDAKASTDGSLQVTERRILDASGAIGSLVWAFDDLPEDASLEVSSVRMAPVDSDGNVAGDWVKLPEVAFVLDWRGAGGPNGDAYSYDSPKNTLYVFSSWSDVRVIVEIEYAVIAGIQIYDDMAQIDWRYVTETWPYAADDVSMTITLPLPSGVKALSGSNVYAWGHGPADGTLSVGTDGEVKYSIPHLDAGRFAEARVLFPQSWLTNLSPQAQAARLKGNVRDTAISEEIGWSDQANFWRKWDVGVVSVSAALSALALLLAVLLFRLRGKPYAAGSVAGSSAGAGSGTGVGPGSGSGESAAFGSAGVELPILDPAVAGRMLRWNEHHVHDITASVVSLVRRGVIAVDLGSYDELSASASAAARSVTLHLDDEKAAAVGSAVDRATLELLFNAIGEGAAQLALVELRKFAHDKPADFVALIDAWQKALSGEVKRLGLFDAKSLRAQKILAGEAVLVLFVGLGSTAAMGNPIPAAFAVPAALIIGAMANYVPRRSPEAAVMLERYEQQMARMSKRGLASAYLPQPEELARLTEELDASLEHAYAKAQVAAAEQRVAASRQGSFGGFKGDAA